MEIFGQKVQYFGIIFARILGLLSVAPVFNAQSVPYRFRMALALLLAVVLYPLTINFLPDLPKHPLAYATLLLGQGAIGIGIGFMIMAIFSSFQIAGQIFSMQAGLSFSEVLDPQAQVSIPVLGTLKNTIGLLLFLVIDFPLDGYTGPAYLHMVRALAVSFQHVKMLFPSEEVTGGLLNHMDRSFGIMFVTALKIGIPVMGILFISSLTLGILGRAAPQMNLLVMGVQVNITVSLIVLITVMPVLIPLMQDVFYKTYDTLGELFRTFPK